MDGSGTFKFKDYNGVVQKVAQAGGGTPINTRTANINNTIYRSGNDLYYRDNSGVDHQIQFV